jgi:hypothetical protein
MASRALQAALKQRHDEATLTAFDRLHRDSFGEIADILDPKLQKLLDKALLDLQNRNELLSTRICEKLENEVCLIAATLLCTSKHR